ncbi:MAG: hypothetical protein RIG84_13705 [Roseovarius sp.]
MKQIFLAAVLALGSAPLAFAEMATGDDIMSAISGNTVQGSMADGAGYTEFYDTDGTIKGADYTGAWTVEADKMCFDYGEGKTCWGVKIEGDMVTWMDGDTADGTGTILSGNPNDSGHLSAARRACAGRPSTLCRDGRDERAFWRLIGR